MLKLTKGHNRSEITVCLRSKEQLFNSLFCKALGIAFAIHFLGWLLFHIHSSKADSSFIFPTVQVQTFLHSPFEELSLHAKSSEYEHLNRFLTPPSKPFFSLSPYSPQLEKEPLDYAFNDIENTSFQILEEAAYSFKHAPALPVSYKPLKVHLTGQLEAYSLTEGKHLKIPFEELEEHLLEPVLIAYEVKIDSRSGRIFWYQLKQTSSFKALNQQTEEILKSLEFEPAPSFIQVEGEIYFMWFINTKDKQEAR